MPEASGEGDAFDGAWGGVGGEEGLSSAVESLVTEVGGWADVEETAEEEFEAAAAEADGGADLGGGERAVEVGVDEVAGGAEFLEAAGKAG